MKKSLGVALGAVLVSSVYGDSILLRPGESYVFSFDARSLPAPLPSPFGDQALGGFDLVINGGGNSGCHWYVEMFENNVSETPIFAEEEENREDCSLQPLFAGAWQDPQGAVRVTAISETLVAPMEVEITVPSSRGFLYYDFHIGPADRARRRHRCQSMVRPNVTFFRNRSVLLPQVFAGPRTLLSDSRAQILPRRHSWSMLQPSTFTTAPADVFGLHWFRRSLEESW
jgi:hypothetical protein